MRTNFTLAMTAVLLGFSGVAFTQARLAPVTFEPLPFAAISTSADESLPEAPEPALMPQSSTPMAAGSAHMSTRVAPRYNFYIEPDETAQPLTGTDKLRMAILEELDGYTEITSVLSGGISHLDNSDPKYGTDKGAFGARIGAAFLRQTSQAVFTEGLGATVFHNDPRYYIMGESHGFFKRVLYAGTRVISTRKDSGAQTVNAPMLLGYLGAAALTQAYYPPPSRSANVVFEGYGLSLGAAALGFEFHEFIGDVLETLHLKKH